MGSGYFAAGEQRAVKVNELFSTIAPRYDLINDLQSFGLHRRWKRCLIRLARIRPGQRALDVCCGTGDLAWSLAGQGAEVVGLDFSRPMLQIAAAKSRRVRNARYFKGPHFIQADAQLLPFADETFDVVTIGYGLRNLASWETGIREMHRVLKPGGRFLALEFGKPSNALWRSMYFAYLKVCVPLFGRVFCHDAEAYAYILESLKHYPAQEGVAAGMRGIGFADIRIINLLGGIMSINYGEKVSSD
jgi:demethylmenaquinone methyltransferase/2-methoxy-6-polyprenyl-1,4-benzoquinol methylase